jgi:hypothetical protein
MRCSLRLFLGSPIMLRIAAPLAALFAFLSLSALYAFGPRETYAAIIKHWGVEPFPLGITFGDMEGLLAAWQCHAQGIDVVVADPCDVLHRAFNYSPLWLVASPLGLGPSATTTAGWLCGLSFLLSLFLLPPPRRLQELPIIVLATLSTMVVFAVERGNPDLMIFMLALAAGYLALRSAAARFFASALGLLAGLLKYYPLTLLALTLRERVSTFLVLNVATLCLALAFAAIYHDDVARGLPTIASGIYYGDMFAAKNLPFGIAETVLGTAGASSRSLGLVLYALLLLFGVANSARFARESRLRQALARLSPAEAIFLTIGGILILGCFFAGQNVGYRGIFLLFALPGLLAMARNTEDRAMQGLGKFAAILILLLMWGECFRTNLILALRGLERGDGIVLAGWLGFWLLRELAWWWTISVLAASVFSLLSQSGTGRWLIAVLWRRPVLAPPR